MTEVEYPWRWLADGLGTTFLVRYPWVDDVRRAVAARERVCVLIPEAAGPLPLWGAWLAELAAREQPESPLSTAGNLAEVTRDLATAYRVEEEGFTGGR